MPAAVRESLVLDDEELDAELLRVTDHDTPLLFARVRELGGAMFVNRLSRLVFDPERFRNDDEEVLASRGVGAIYLKTTEGRELRDPSFTAEDREEILRTYYDPYAAAFDQLVRGVVAGFGRCLIIDCHSYPLVPMGWELDADRTHRPPVSLGTDPFHTPISLVDVLEQRCRRAGMRTERNRPFAGT